MGQLSVSITGHTSGIGFATARSFTERGDRIKGFSRSNGFDLGDPATIRRIVDAAEDSSVFINNAFFEFKQVDLLFALFERWKDQDKLIINIGSNSGDGNKDYVHPYAIAKAALDKATAQINNLRSAQCRVSTIRFGYVRTPGIEAYGIKEDMLEIADAVRTIMWIVDQPRHVRIPTLTMLPRKFALNLEEI